MDINVGSLMDTMNSSIFLLLKLSKKESATDFGKMGFVHMARDANFVMSR
jgi:hypothetical protein